MRSYRSARGRYNQSCRFKPQTRSIPPALGPVLALKRLEEAATEEKEVEISDCQCIASYNLLEGLQKTILVPGRPPVWTPLPAHTPIRPDDGEYYRDENAARFPEYPMEPAIKAIFHTEPAFDPSKIDVFACASTLGDVLQYAMGRPQPFSFTVHMIGNTAFFLRRNLSPTELIDDVHGYGHSFPEANTTWCPDAKGSHSHQRIVRYSFGGLQFLVRFEADGYTLDQADDSDGEGEMVNRPTSYDSISSHISAEDALERLFKSKSVEVGSGKNSSIELRSQGRSIAQSSIFELKTRSIRKPRDETITEQLPRLWLRHVRQLVIALHTQGNFEYPDVLDIEDDLDEWQVKWKNSLGIMANTIRDIWQAAAAAEDRKLEVRGSESKVLHFHKLSAEESGQWNAMPDELRRRWVRG